MRSSPGADGCTDPTLDSGSKHFHYFDFWVVLQGQWPCGGRGGVHEAGHQNNPLAQSLPFGEWATLCSPHWRMTVAKSTSTTRASHWIFAALWKQKAFAVRKSWQERCTDWRDAREEVVIMGPDKFSCWTTPATMSSPSRLASSSTRMMWFSLLLMLQLNAKGTSLLSTWKNVVSALLCQHGAVCLHGVFGARPRFQQSNRCCTSRGGAWGSKVGEVIPSSNTVFEIPEHLSSKLDPGHGFRSNDPYYAV